MAACSARLAARDVSYLPYDGACALFEHLRVAADFFAVFAFQSLRGQLDRRQRVLDFMGDAPGDVGPGGVALSGHQLGNVIECYYMAVVFFARFLGSDPHGEIPLLPLNDDGDLSFGRS